VLGVARYNNERPTPRISPNERARSKNTQICQIKPTPQDKRRAVALATMFEYM